MLCFVLLLAGYVTISTSLFRYWLIVPTTAHEEAYEAGVIHRDISAGNILLYKQDDGEWYGLLNDWELSKQTNSTVPEGRQPDRTVSNLSRPVFRPISSHFI